MPRQSFWHVTAAARWSAGSLCRPPAAPWLWAALRRGFPDAVAAVLMPDHLHFIPLAANEARLRASLATTLGHFSRRLGPGESAWREVDVRRLPNRQAVMTAVRYVALNPCRSSRCDCDDPLSWLWSTHRDVMGATVDPWVPAARLAAHAERPADAFRETFHRYVSGDPSVDPLGTPAPRAAATAGVAHVPIDDLVAAVAAALRIPCAEVRARSVARRLLVRLAGAVGLADRRLLMTETGLSRSTVQRTLRGPPDPAAVAAALLCLGDARLRRPAAPA